MKKIVLVLLAMAMLSGCAQIVWVHPEYTPEKWKKDSYECERDARQSGYFGTGITGSINMQNFFNRCLESKGWMRQQEASTRHGESTPSETTSCFHENKLFYLKERVCIANELYVCDRLSPGVIGWRKLENNCP